MRVRVLADASVSVTFSTYQALMDIGGADAFALYFRYVMQARLQRSDVTKSYDQFMAEAMGWGLEKFYKVKGKLKATGLVESVRDTNPDGTFGPWRVAVYSFVETNDTTEVEIVKEKPKRTRKKASASQNPKDSLTTDFPESGGTSLRLTSSVEGGNGNEVETGIQEGDNEASVTRNDKTAFRIALRQQFREFCGDNGYAFLDDQFEMRALVNTKVLNEAFARSPSFIRAILDYANSDRFWKGKVTTYKSFRLHWATLYNQLASHGDVGSQDKAKAKDAVTEMLLSLK